MRAILAILLSFALQATAFEGRTIQGFSSLTTNMTMVDVTNRFGPYDRKMGSGICRFFYDLPDGSKISILTLPAYKMTNKIALVIHSTGTNSVTLVEKK